MATAMQQGTRRVREAHEEFANSVTHGIGLLLSLIAFVLLMEKAAAYRHPLQWTGMFVYAISLIAVYGASFLSHCISEPRWKQYFAVLDQACIYFVIAGSYTAYAAAFLHGPAWIPLHAAIWGVAIAGMVSKLAFRHRVDRVSLPLYLMLGWLPVSAGYEMARTIPWPAIQWVVAGGLCYTVGTFVLKNDHQAPYLHAVWHLLVIAGSVCHFLGIYLHGFGG